MKANMTRMERAIISRTNDLLAGRREVLAPFPVPPMDVYNSIYTEKEHAAIQFLQSGMADIFVRNKTMDLIVPSSMAHDPTAQYFKPLCATVIRINFPEPIPMPSYRSSDYYRRVSLERLDPVLQDTLVRWMHRWTLLDAERLDVVAKVTQAFRVCNTIGQVERLWPGIVALSDTFIQDQLAKAKARSPLPRLRDPDAWSSEALQWANQCIAEALCLSPDEEVVEKALATVIWRIG